MSIEAETAVVTQQKEVAQKNLKTAQSGFLAKIFQPGKYKNEEAARLKESYNEVSRKPSTVLSKHLD